jgi:flagellar protein FliS
MINNAYQQYKNNSIMTATPAQLTLMLYNGAIKFCNQGIEAIENNNIQQAHQVIIKAQNIISELQATLDLKYSIAKEMDAIYTFIKQLLVEANIQKNKEKLLDAKELIVGFRDTWEQISKARA